MASCLRGRPAAPHRRRSGCCGAHFSTSPTEPVEDVYEVGSDDDELELFCRRDPDSRILSFGLTRLVVLVSGVQLAFYTDSQFPELQLDEEVSVLGIGGSSESASRFAAEVERTPLFGALRSEAIPATFEYGQDLVE